MTHWYDEVDKKYSSRMYPASSFNPSEKCVALLEHFEGFSETAYLDVAGIPTIGHGFIKGVKMGDTITHRESVARKLVEMNTHWNGIKNYIHVNITQNICDALTSWCYNVGVGAVRNSTLIRVLNQGGYEKAADELLRWDKARVDGVLRSIRGLTRRRNAEREMFLGNDWGKYYE